MRFQSRISGHFPTAVTIHYITVLWWRALNCAYFMHHFIHPNSTRTSSDQIINEGFLCGQNMYFSFLSLFSRSFINFVYFTVRHLDCHVHLDNEWLKAQYNMYYYTILPGFNYTVGIADSAKFWYYGPESQLYFLDSYI